LKSSAKLPRLPPPLTKLPVHMTSTRPRRSETSAKRCDGFTTRI
jgi:hypothetical protein